jgi:tetratricopeptide (TPR) repeat protein
MRNVVYGILGLVIASAGVAWFVLDAQLLTPDQRAYRTFAAGDFESAAGEFADPLWRGVSLYRAKDFKAAEGVFAGIDTPAGALNHGNALLFQGKYEEAAKRYERALELRPGWEDAIVNRDLALARAALLETEGGDMTGGQMEAESGCARCRPDRPISCGPSSATSTPRGRRSNEAALAVVDAGAGAFVRPGRDRGANFRSPGASLGRPARDPQDRRAVRGRLGADPGPR